MREHSNRTRCTAFSVALVITAALTEDSRSARQRVHLRAQRQRRNIPALFTLRLVVHFSALWL
ncbi:hypothetical protein DPEC_G00111030 [Dallia pectoralis]|uniref:Uncharacterized protein n=1 Tax=Dallia pectoralis TaxID=75939 RepID=A0ACC2GTS2_DALPE|nr:hypothetical protein DPEC_G00111030 [Dallia pectoralis]